MRRHFALGWTICAVLCPVAATGQFVDFTGTYSMTTDRGEELTLSLTQTGQGIVRGGLSGAGGVFDLEGVVEGDLLTGTIHLGREPLYFEAYSEGTQLVMYMAPDASTGIDYFRAQELVFSRSLSRRQDLGAPPPVGADPLRSGDPLGLGNPLAPQSPAGTAGFDGVFTDGVVTLELHGGGTRFAGQLTVDGRVYPVTGQVVDQTFMGSFSNGMQRFPIQVYREDYGVTVESEGQRYFLRYRQEFDPALGDRDWWNRRPYAVTPPLSDGSLTSLRWLESLRGRHLTTGVATTGRRRPTRQAGADVDLYLCSAGYVVDGRGYRAAGPGRGLPPSRQFPGQADGQWRVIAPDYRPILEVRFIQGEILQFALAYADGLITLDGLPVQLEMAAGVCQ
jgi:hypothetical protein